MTYLDSVAAELERELEGALPDTDGVADLLRGYAVLLLAKGIDVTPEDVHNAWVAWMTARDPAHNALRPYRQLDDATKAEDEPFLHAIKRVAARHRRTGAP